MLTKTSANGELQAEQKQRLQTLLNSEVPLEMRQALLGELVFDESPPARKLLEQFLNRAAAGHGDELAQAKQAEFQALIDQLKAGPMRPATYISPFESQGLMPPRIRLRTPSGEDLLSLAPHDDLRNGLQFGDTVWIDGQGRCALYKQQANLEAGEVVRFERRHDDRRILVTVHDHDSLLMLTTQALAERIKLGQVAPGAKLLACLNRRMAFESLEESDTAQHFRYLSRDPLPEVRLDRDVGDPPPYVAEVLAHIRRELTTPELGRKYRIRRAQTKLLAGVSGSGKTLSIEATIRAAYDFMAGHIGVPVEELPLRVMRLRFAEIASQWFGNTDKAIDRFFDEALALGAQKYVAPNNQEYHLPLFLTIEESDSIGMARGGEETYSRIQGTLLQRLDANSRRFGDQFVIVLATTNVPHLLDTAFLRRVGGTVERFGRLSRRGCAAVLEKHVSGLPLPESYGSEPACRERHVIRTLLAWLFGQSGDDPDLVDVTYVGSANPAKFRRRAFLTGGLIDRAVQQAAHTACRLESEGAGESVPEANSQGVSCELLIKAFDTQIRAIVEQLSEHNVGNYLTLPHGARVAQVRRLDSAPLSRRDLQRSAVR